MSFIVYYLDRRMHFDFSMNEYVFGIDKPLADTTIEKKRTSIAMMQW